MRAVSTLPCLWLRSRDLKVGSGNLVIRAAHQSFWEKIQKTTRMKERKNTTRGSVFRRMMWYAWRKYDSVKRVRHTINGFMQKRYDMLEGSMILKESVIHLKQVWNQLYRKLRCHVPSPPITPAIVANVQVSDCPWMFFMSPCVTPRRAPHLHTSWRGALFFYKKSSTILTHSFERTHHAYWLY